MRIIIAADYDQMSRMAACVVASRLILKPDLTLGLATGDTPKGLYRELVGLYRKGDLDFSRATTFNLDEYCGLGPCDDGSYHRFMENHLWDHVNLSSGRRHIPDGRASDPAGECRRYERLIASIGGIDLQILGLGHDGHIGFNEPDTVFREETHVTELAPSTVRANARFFDSPDEVPCRAVTMGVGTIMKAREVFFLVSGQGKAEILKKVLRGPVTPEVPASILQYHRNATAFVDREAASAL